MKFVNVHEDKTHLTEYLAQVEAGKTVLICRRNSPIAERRPLPRPASGSRRTGLAKGGFSIQDSFFDPMPADLLDAFEGKGT